MLAGGVIVTVPVEGGGGGVAPVAVSMTSCGELGSLSLIWSIAVRVPVAVGVNVTEIVQLALAASEAGQLLVCA